MTDQLLHRTDGEISVDEMPLEVGKRVRAIRSKRGLTRKNLAHHSNISERYLAELEKGSANISLTLLLRIVRALGVGFSDLFPEQNKSTIKYPPLGELIETYPLETQQKAFQLLKTTFNADQENYHGVALTGLRGGGKSTLGKALAKHFNVPFVQLHTLISQLAGMEMGELISLTGQGVYRQLELQVLQQTINEYHHVVVETGGSLISESETFRILRENFFTVWVRALPEDHMQRVVDQGDLRPMEGNQRAMDDLKLMLAERDAHYRLSDYQIMTSNYTIDESLEMVVKACAPYLRD